MILRDGSNVHSLYFIGIGGVSMSALAKFFVCNHCKVSGSDIAKNEYTQSLTEYGVQIFVGIDAARAQLHEADIVVYTDAISESNAELQMARRLNRRIYSRADLLWEVSRLFKEVIAVAGSHGKTTCTAMCAHILRELGADFTAHIGGNDGTLSNFCSFGKEYFVTEACEYKRNLLKLQPTRAILLNIDYDHMECYRDIDDLTACFEKYIRRSQIAIVCADDKRCENFTDCVTFGIDNETADYRAVHLQTEKERYSFTVTEYGKTLCRVKLRAVGKCNVYNALAAFAVMRSYGFDAKRIAQGLQSFSTIKRRFERIGEYRGASFICDYAHHPREIAATIETAKGVCKGKLYVVFQPHTYSRTKLLMDEFQRVLEDVPQLMIYKTYAAREKYDEEGSALRLAQKVHSLYCENITALKAWIDKTVGENDLLLFLGAGDIYYVAEYLLKCVK